MIKTGLDNPVYARFGVTPVINAGGTHTTHGGSMMKPEVLEAMKEASRSYVDLVELKRATGRFVAEVTGAEAGMITCGAASGIVLATAACMTGTDEAAVRLLPNTDGLRDEIVMQMAHYGAYGNVHSFAGATVILAGSVAGCTAGELDRAITDATAAVSYTFAYGAPSTDLSLRDVVEVAHARDVPVMVDSAAMLPPKENLHRFIREGADLVTFSGGKFIGGPQSTGLLFGREDLIEAALMNSGPGQSIGRPQKVGREDLIGMATALQLYVEADEEADIDRMRRQAEHVRAEVAGLSGIRASVELDQQRYFVPNCVISFESGPGDAGSRIAAALHEGDPRIYVARAEGGIAVNPFNLQEGQEQIVGRRLVEEITALA